MKILLLSLKDHEGAGIYVLNVLNDFKRRNIEAKLLVAEKKSNHEDVFIIKTEPFIHKIFRKLENRLDVYSKKYDFHNRGRFILNEADLFKVKKEFDFDKIILFWTSSLISPKTLLKFKDKTPIEILLWPLDKAFLFGGCHFNVECEKHLINCDNCPAVPAFAKKIPKKNILDNRKLIGSSRLITHSLWFNDYLESLFPEKEPLFYFPDSETLFSKGKRVKKSEDDNTVRLLFCSTNIMDERKGFYLFKKIISGLDEKLLNGNKNIHLITVGNNIPKLPLNNIKQIHHGYIESKEILNQVYSNADILISTSLDDIGPSVLLEACLNGCIPIAFNVGVAKDIIQEDINGYCVPNYNTQVFQEKLELSLCLSSEKKELLKLNSEKIIKNYFKKLKEKNNLFEFI
jgi:glycosyltransferase involved in cell wall biosynthesis